MRLLNELRTVTVYQSIAIFSGVLVALDLPLLLGTTIVEYRNPYDTSFYAIFIGGPGAPYVHVVLFAGTLTLYLLRKKRAE